MIILIGMHKLLEFIMFWYETRMILIPVPQNKLISFGFNGMELIMSTDPDSERSDCTELDSLTLKKMMVHLALLILSMCCMQYIFFQLFHWEQRTCV